MNRLRHYALIATALVAVGCDRVVAPLSEYRPGEAGSVDQAMCHLGFTAVPLRRLITGHHLVDVTLNGQVSTFVLDTGANVSVIHRAFVDEFRLGRPRGVTGAAIGLGGALKAERSAVDDFRLGGVKVRQRHLMAADLSEVVRVLGTVSPRPIHGIIGQDVMRERRAVIDVARPMLYLSGVDGPPTPAGRGACGAPT